MRGNKFFSFSFLVLYAVSIIVAMVGNACASAGIVVDGNPDDWLALGLSPSGTDPPFNIESYHDICADLLEAWIYNDTENLYLMIKVRGGYPEDWNKNAYIILLDADGNPYTGSPGGYEYSIGGVKPTYGPAFGTLDVWNTTILTWSSTHANVDVKAGSLGYVEWRVPLKYLNITGLVDFKFVSWDDTLDEPVNTISVNHVYIVPEYMSTLTVLILIFPLTFIIFAFKKLLHG